VLFLLEAAKNLLHSTLVTKKYNENVC